MSHNLFSRSYLQSIPLENKRLEVSKLISYFLQDLLSAAGAGRKNYLFDMTDMEHVQTMENQHIINDRYLSTRPKYYTIPIDEMVPLFLEKFPDCTVTYQEIMIDTKLNFKVPKKGILIDWS